MCVFGGGLELRVAEKSGDDRQVLAERQSPRRPAVPKVMKAHVLESGSRPDTSPVLVDVENPFLLIRDTPPVGMYVLNVFSMCSA